ncbi:GNAT family N-acetyltransferase [Nonomuraea sp. NPDC003709]|uniref:GNAT family N-acetyltransferase n=1 Tax=Nonomuraea sp. NPDC003709 TaxID=3154450 RepID=UPI00339EB9C3
MPATPARPKLGPRGQAGAATSEIRLIPASEVRDFLAAVADVADQVFTSPPWTEPREAARAVAERLAADAPAPGFTFAAALHGDQLHGFAYGVRCSRLALLASRLPRHDFTLKELAVAPPARGYGLGRMLHDALLAAAPSTSWWLVTHPQAGAALGLYRRRGWRVAALRPGPQNRPRLIMLREPSH